MPQLPEEPLVSIIVPSFNQGRFIGETLRSVLEQDYRNIELLVIDGGSRDETVQVLEQYAADSRLHWISEPDKGVADAVNKGLRMATGEVCAVQSSDDSYLPGAISAAVAELRRDDRPGIVYGDTIKTDEHGAELGRHRVGPFSLEGWLSKRTYIPQPGAFFRLDVARVAGEWDSAYYNCDTEFWLRMLWLAPVRKFERFLSLRRMHGEQRDTQGARIIEADHRMIANSARLRTLPARYRRAAEAGRLFHEIRYSGLPAEHPDNRRRLRQAVLRYPECTPHLQARYRFLPGVLELLRAAGALRRRLRALREAVGVVVIDLPRMLPRLATRDGWVRACNRGDALVPAPDGRGVACTDAWSSDLHACRVFPALGRMLMRRALRQWPVSFAHRNVDAGRPDVTFVIPHRGAERLPLLCKVIGSILAQEGVLVECIVVEQSGIAEATGLPDGVRVLHLPHATDPGPWRKSWALNAGVEMARGDVVICHDGDILVPAAYAAEALEVMRRNSADVVFLQRFLFYLDAESSEIPAIGAALARGDCERVNQNWVGGTFAIRKQSYQDIGGFDEDFVDWGGEDNEFFDRCALLRRSAFGYLPFVHLWHEPQVAKVSEGRTVALARLAGKLATPAAVRVDRLRARDVEVVGAEG